nr:hypothetical protein [uncultured Blautia sp.]
MEIESILDREFKKKLEERVNRMGLTAVQLRVLGELRRLESMGVEEINQRDLRKALAVQEYEKYKAQLKKSGTKYKILSKKTKEDGSIVIEIKKQYNSSPGRNSLQKISTHLLTVLIKGVIVLLEQEKSTAFPVCEYWKCFS